MISGKQNKQDRGTCYIGYNCIGQILRQRKGQDCIQLHKTRSQQTQTWIILVGVPHYNHDPITDTFISSVSYLGTEIDTAHQKCKTLDFFIHIKGGHHQVEDWLEGHYLYNITKLIKVMANLWNNSIKSDFKCYWKVRASISTKQSKLVRGWANLIIWGVKVIDP